MNAPVRALFVADGGPQVGGGHVMRCLTLADALTRAGAECGFVAGPGAKTILSSFAGRKIRRFAAPSGDPAALCAFAAHTAKTWGARFAVLDHYGASAEDDTALRAAAGRLLVLEDMRRRRVCDLVLDTNLGRRASDYPGADVLLGPAFALVRPEFLAHRAAALARRRADAPAQTLLVSLGLTDVGAITGRVVREVLPMLGDRRLAVVLGAGSPSLGEITALANEDARVALHANTKDMAELMVEADLAIGAGGSSAWERCVLGLPSISLILADNQRENSLALAAAGAGLSIEVNGFMPARLAEAFQALTNAGSARARMAEAAARLCDGQGAARVAERMLAMAAG